MEPMQQPGPIRFWRTRGTCNGDWIGSPEPCASGRHVSNPMYVYWNRSVFGLKALLFQLRAQVDVNEIFRRERPAIWPGR